MNSIKKLLPLLMLLLTFYCKGQQRDTTGRDTLMPHATMRQQDTNRNNPEKKDTATKNKISDTLNTERKVKQPLVLSRVSDSVRSNALPSKIKDSTTEHLFLHSNDSLSITGRALSGIRWVNVKAGPEFLVSTEKTFEGKEIFFYTMCALLLLLGLFKMFYNHYFSNIFRVYFNTSLRQSQLSEQMLQARLPSFMFNIYFVIITGIFVWLIFSRTEGTVVEKPVYLLEICIGAVAVVYLIKYCFLKFIGWVSGISEATDYYIFIIFLVNKILALLLIPFIILLAFGKSGWVGIVETLALLSAGALLLSRYIKSYAVAGHKLSVKPFHFLLFIAGAELIPILLIYKIAVDYFVI